MVSSRDLYGATQALFRDVMTPLGVETRYAPATDLAAFEGRSARRGRASCSSRPSRTRCFASSTCAPSWPSPARRAPSTIVDSTFASPRLLTPLAFGADFVVHSTTKYLNGHGDATGGIVVCANTDSLPPLRQVSKLVGGILGPFEAYLTLRGVKTLALRMPRQCQSARQMAEQSRATIPPSSRFTTPGFPRIPDFAIALRGCCATAWPARSSPSRCGARAAPRCSGSWTPQLCCVGTTVGDIYSQLLYPAISRTAT